MGMGLHEWPLMFFTVIGQSVAGAFIIMGCAILSGKLPEALNRKVHYSMFGLWLLMGIGFFTLHDPHGNPNACL
ncbi:anaerobic dimethyl sulfoxide reductase chain C [Proteus mirabilis]|uniref:Anaerobic dimethyl sulfoxide reductase chain C n=1 Tax=Proteus mirabilis TaxID=584 RepID=A0A2X2C791_PROMI|nr:anaerobic dimethyl sulfoxide reductase chain C [Proteus mirabilis]